METTEERRALRRLRTWPAHDDERELMEDLAARGLVEPRPNAIGEGYHYVLTDAGRAAAREGEDREPLTADIARGMHPSKLREVWGDTELARRQLELRERGRRLAVGVLAGLGYRFGGTGGWHVTAYASDDHRLGFVNIAKGVAAITTVELDASLVEALTVPDQGHGPKASGAAAWSSPDVGEPHHARAPRGWRQLLVDVREDVGDPVEPIETEARVCMWGLATCYEGRTGRPGAGSLCDRSRIPPRDWTARQDVREALLGAGDEWLRSVVMRLARMTDRANEVEATLHGPIASAVRATGRYEQFGESYSPDGAVRSALDIGTSSIAFQALHRAGIVRVASVSGDMRRAGGGRLLDVIEGLLEQIVREALRPHSDTLHRQLLGDAYDTERSERHRDPYWRVNVHVVPPILRAIGATIADEVLRSIDRPQEPLRRESDEVVARLYDTFYAASGGAPVEVDFPHELPEEERGE